MTVIIQPNYVLPIDEQSLCYPRIAHAENWLSGGTASAFSTDPDYFETAPLNSLTFERWKPNGTGWQSWEYDHGSSVSCDYCAIAGHTMGSSGTEFKVQYYDGSDWVDLTASQEITDNSPVFCIFRATTAQRWRIVADSTSAPEFSLIKFGTALQVPEGIYSGHTPESFSQRPTLRTNMSETGEFLGTSVQRRGGEASYEWTRIPYVWFDQNWRSIKGAVETDPLWVAWRPLQRGDVAFGHVTETPVPQQTGVRTNMSVTLNMKTLGYA